MGAMVLVVLVILIMGIFSAQNALPVAVSFLSWQFNGSLAVIALLFFLVGMLAGMAVMFWTRMRRVGRTKQV